ncbi:hypothetical protein NIGALANA_294 [Bacillus phage Nigalana]|uniref:hypothetical protein n=1 Tax=Bacillus phage Nigalana TaxID=1805951 RepID=UPI0007A776A1|nr:hypothetical protein BI005_gp294 [Bacillus phage Nigalana]AMW61438.1 hypothetical protein NIGALANA_294 [Bacillus phage Nigalana]
MRKGSLVILKEAKHTKVCVVLYLYKHGITDDAYARIYSLDEHWETSYHVGLLRSIGEVDKEHVSTITGGRYK